jgi:hypothetical protein
VLRFLKLLQANHLGDSKLADIEIAGNRFLSLQSHWFHRKLPPEAKRKIKASLTRKEQTNQRRQH